MLRESKERAKIQKMLPKVKLQLFKMVYFWKSCFDFVIFEFSIAGYLVARLAKA